MEKKMYIYEGAVLMFDRVVTDCFKARTYAVSAKKARTNLEYQYKVNNGLAATTKIRLAAEPVAATL